jgi:hypothetical protein
MFCNVQTLKGFYVDTKSVGNQERKIHLQCWMFKTAQTNQTRNWNTVNYKQVHNHPTINTDH